VIGVLLVDDQALFRSGIRMLVDSQADLHVLGEAADGTDVPDAVERTRPDVVLMDVRMPGLDGIEATRRLVERYGDEAPRVIVLTTFDFDAATADAIAAGASGFLLKDAEPELLLASIRAVASGSQVIAAKATQALFQRFRARSATAPGPEYERLTERERQMLLLAAEGLSNAEIAARETLSEATVKTHLSRILAKLGLRDRVQLVVYAYENGLV
jgi:DNA-binding NarL/FixJ family response regulator